MRTILDAFESKVMWLIKVLKSTNDAFEVVEAPEA